MRTEDDAVSDEVLEDSSPEDLEGVRTAPESTPRRRGGSKPGRTFQRVPRKPGEKLIASHYRLRKWEKRVLATVGGGDETAGVRKLVAIAADLLGIER